MSVVIPAYNEEENVLRAIDDARRTVARLSRSWEIVLIDDGSTDGTAGLVARMAAADRRIRLIAHEGNLGYGAALRTGLSSATLDVVFFTDGDNQFEMSDLELALPLIDEADVVAGYRMSRGDAWPRRLAATAWNRLVRSLFDLPVRDVDCAFKLFRRPVLQGLELESSGAMASTELMMKLHRAGCRIVEVGVRHRPRRAGRATGLSPPVVLRAFRELVRFYRSRGRSPG